MTPLSDNDHNPYQPEEHAPRDDQPQPAAAPAGQGERRLKAHEEEADIWPLEADRLAIQDALVDCLRIMAGHYGRRTSRASLTAGMPIPAQGITPVLFMRAAERAGLHARLIDRPLSALAAAPNLPCILVLEDRQACILWDVKPAGKGKKGGEEDH